MKKMILIASIMSSFAFASTAGKICERDRVNFGSRVGTALEVFSNGKVRIDMDDSYTNAYKNVSELGRGVNCFKRVCRNDRVNFGSRAGRVLEVFDNGTARIDMDDSYTNSYKDVSEIGKGFRCVEDICQGDRVEFNGRVGKALEVFDNGIVRIDMDDSYTNAYKEMSDLGYEVRCSINSSSRDTSCHGRND
jgi:membrane protein implicated in regulation of membrane protease activity